MAGQALASAPIDLPVRCNAQDSVMAYDGLRCLTGAFWTPRCSKGNGDVLALGSCTGVVAFRLAVRHSSERSLRLRLRMAQTDECFGSNLAAQTAH